jgi:hypothetical protein
VTRPQLVNGAGQCPKLETEINLVTKLVVESLGNLQTFEDIALSRNRLDGAFGE